VSAIVERPLPDGALLASYDTDRGYVDCLEAKVTRGVSLPELIAAFYNSRAFRPERWLLGAVLGRKAGQAEVLRLADAQADRFSAWTVEARSADQILLCDIQGRTRSWLMVLPQGQDTRLLFGTAVIEGRGRVFRMLLWFHKAYARALLAGAVRGLSR
jgi:hypothetical protein